MAPKQIAVAQALYHVIPFIPMTVEIVAPELVLIVLMPMNMTAAKPILTTAEMRVLVRHKMSRPYHSNLWQGVL